MNTLRIRRASVSGTCRVSYTDTYNYTELFDFLKLYWENKLCGVKKVKPGHLISLDQCKKRWLVPFKFCKLHKTHEVKTSRGRKFLQARFALVGIRSSGSYSREGHHLQRRMTFLLIMKNSLLYAAQTILPQQQRLQHLIGGLYWKNTSYLRPPPLAILIVRQPTTLQNSTKAFRISNSHTNKCLWELHLALPPSTATTHSPLRLCYLQLQKGEEIEHVTEHSLAK